jgi:hypothetical protein
MDEALSILAGDVSLQVGQEILALCRPLAPSPIQPEATDTATWLCRDPLFFTLFKTHHSPSTLLYSHSNGVLYHASPQAQLSLGCPACTGFLCQFTRDALPEGAVPRLLVFDVVSQQAMAPPGRGDFLRALAQHLPQPLCTVQWVGPSRYLTREFVAQLPHAIGGLMRLGADPLGPGAWGLDE